MNDDRELLELALKAMGAYLLGEGCFWVCRDFGLVISDGHPTFKKPKQMGLRSSEVCGNCGWGWSWNPLRDDGDRYRLAQDLRISIDFNDCYAWKRFPDHTLIQEFWGGDCGDEAHAVLRVAAEIGRRMNSGSDRQ